MDSTQDLIETYTQEYKLDELTKQKAVELYNEFLGKHPNPKSVSLSKSILFSHK